MDMKNERLNILQLCINTLGFDHELQFGFSSFSVDQSSVRPLDCVHYVFELDWEVTLKL